MYYFDAGLAKKVNTFGKPIGLGIYNSLDACLDNQLSTFQTWCVGDIDSSPIAIVITGSYFGDSVGLGMQDIGECFIRIVFTAILKTRGSTIVSVGDDHLIFYE